MHVLFLVGGQNMYVNTLLHCHFCIQIITHHFLLSKVSLPIHAILSINADLLYAMLFPWKYSISHKLLYCPVCIFSCFHGNQHCVASCHYFYTTGSGYNTYGETIWLLMYPSGLASDRCCCMVTDLLIFSVLLTDVNCVAHI